MILLGTADFPTFHLLEDFDANCLPSKPKLYPQSAHESFLLSVPHFKIERALAQLFVERPKYRECAILIEKFHACRSNSAIIISAENLVHLASRLGIFKGDIDDGYATIAEVGLASSYRYRCWSAADSHSKDETVPNSTAESAYALPELPTTPPPPPPDHPTQICSVAVGQSAGSYSFSGGALSLLSDLGTSVGTSLSTFSGSGGYLQNSSPESFKGPLRSRDFGGNSEYSFAVSTFNSGDPISCQNSSSHLLKSTLAQRRCFKSRACVCATITVILAFSAAILAAILVLTSQMSAEIISNQLAVNKTNGVATSPPCSGFIRKNSSYDFVCADNISCINELDDFSEQICDDCRNVTCTAGANSSCKDCCPIVEFSGENLDNIARVHWNFVGHMNMLNYFAKQADVKIVVTESYRPAYKRYTFLNALEFSNKLVGHGVNVNLRYGYNNENMCNSRCLSKPTMPKPVQRFIDAVRQGTAEGVTFRWGGDDSTDKNSIKFVRIDDGFYQNSPADWQKEFEKMNNNCDASLY